MALPPDRTSYNDCLSAQTIHDLRAPLTVIQGQAQLVERWVRRNHLADGEMVLGRLSAITSIVAHMVVELDALREPGSPSPCSDRPADGV